MIKLATVFSGIGAIEHALDRMYLDYEIKFACDNGDVDILSKKIKCNLDEIYDEINSLEKKISNIEINKEDKYQEELYNMLISAKIEYNLITEYIDKAYTDDVLKLTNDILYKTAKINKKYKILYESFTVIKNNKNKFFYSYKCLQNFINDFKKTNKLADLSNKNKLKNSDDIYWNEIYENFYLLYIDFEKNNGKNLIKIVQDLSTKVGMLYEKINTLYILKDLSNIKDFKKKKEYVDKLYETKISQNKVRESYFANYKIDKDNFHWNISFLDGNQYKNEIDLFVGGSPCQSFSLVGKQRGLEDTRGTLFYEYARLVKEIQPKIFIYENVKAILSNDKGRTWNTITKVFTDLEYNWTSMVLNAKNFGIPQNRERLFVVGFRKDLNLSQEFSEPIPINLVEVMQDFLLENVSGRYYLPEKGVDFVLKEKNLSKRYTQIDGEIQLCQKKNQQFNWHGDFIFEEENIDKEKTMEDLEKYFLSEKVRKYVLSSGTKNFYSKPKTDLKIARPLLTTMHKMHRAGIDNYVTTDGRLRKLTPRECFRLMGFCDSFKIIVSDTAAYQQAGNSIVVDVLIHIMESIIDSYPSLLSDEQRLSIYRKNKEYKKIKIK